MSGYATRSALPVRLVALACVAGGLVGYTLAVDPVVHSAAQVAYPLVWVGASVACLWAVRDRLPSPGPVEAAVGAGYTLALLWTAGLVGTSAGGTTLSVHFAMPGWGPAITYVGPVVMAIFVPFLTVGYLTLGILAAVAVRTTIRSAAAGVLGLFACVSCTAPLVAGLAGSLGAGSVAATVSSAQYPIATVAFLLSAGMFVALIRSGGALACRVPGS